MKASALALLLMGAMIIAGCQTPELAIQTEPAAPQEISPTAAENEAPSGQTELESIYLGLWQEMNIIREGGEVSPERYQEILLLFEKLSNEGYDATKVRALKETFVRTVKLPDQTPSQEAPAQSCASNRNPVFTSHITDVDKIANVVTPPVIIAGSLKTHSYVETQKQRVPVYAPADMTLVTGAFYTAGPYWLGFEVTCEITLRFAHITEPLQEIKDLFPDTPSQDSRDQQLKGTIAFKAGDLIGYTTGTSQAGNWDFGVYDSGSSNRYAGSAEWGNSWVYTTAVCPYDFFSPELKQVYVGKYNKQVYSSMQRDGPTFCQ